MNKLVLWLFLFVSGLAAAQNVSIPDANFKNFLVNAGTGSLWNVARNATGNYVKIDTNNDGEIQVTEAQAIWYVNLYQQQSVTSLQGIEAFANLRSLWIQQSGVTALQLTSLQWLEEVICPSNQLSSLQINGLSHLKRLFCYGNSLSGINFTGLTSLQEIRCSHNPITTADLSLFPSLKIFECAENPTLTSLIAAGHQSLEEIDITGSSLASLNVSNIPTLKSILAFGCSSLTQLNMANSVNLETLRCMSTQVGNLNLTGFTHLVRLEVNYCPISQLDLSNLTSLEYFNGDHTDMATLTLANLPNLKELYCSETNISSINLSGMPKLEYVAMTANAITQLTLTDLPKLEFLHLSQNPLHSITVGYLPKLTTFTIIDTYLVSMDVSQCPILSTLIMSVTPTLEYLNVKNGSASLTNFSVSNNLANLRICADENEVQSLYNLLAGNSIVNLMISNYCTFTPGGSYNTVSGAFLMNMNSTDCTPASQHGYNVKIMLNDGSQAYSAISNNNYAFYTEAGSYTLTPEPENSNWFTVTPASATVTFANTNNNTATQNFCISPNGSHPDVEVLIVPRFAQPGFDAMYEIVYKNKGNQILSGDVVLSYDDNVMDFVNSSVAPTTSATGSLLFNYTNLQPFESRVIAVTLNMNGPMEVPALNNGDHLNFTASITPITGDETPGDNTFVLEQTLVGSFDPNDISCLEGDTEHPDNIGKYLHYNINFENTGTVPATFIVVKDMIDTAKFDIASLQLINASHNVKTRINGNKVEFYFDAINLGPNQKGNVLFKIKTLPSLAVNSSVTQNANIYFDYNWPITTNDATTTFQLLSTGDFAQDTSMKIYPNPSSSVVTISAATTISTVQLYDVQGRLLEAVSPKLNEATVDISQRANGIYFMKISTGNGVKIEKVIKN